MQKTLAEPNLENLLKLFEFDKKRDIEQHCRQLVISGEAFFQLVCSCDMTGIPFLHKILWRDSAPDHLNPSEAELKALANSGPGLIKDPQALKAVRKMSQIFVERRYLVGHIFHVPDLTKWHFFCFDQRDLEGDKPNHWKEGSHVHFTNWVCLGKMPSLSGQISLIEATILRTQSTRGFISPGISHAQSDSHRQGSPTT